MSTEYVKFRNSEVVYAQKVFLQSQLEILDVMKRHKNFMQLRNEEFMLKIALKNKIDLLLKDIDSVEKSLPKATFKSKKLKGSDDTPITRSENLSLEEEISAIRAKLQSLQS